MPERDGLPFPVYEALLDSGYDQVLAQLNKHYISKLDEGGNTLLLLYRTGDGVTIFYPTPLTRTLASRVSCATVVEEYNKKTREVLDKESSHKEFPATQIGEKNEVTMEDFNLIANHCRSLAAAGRELLEEDYETKLIQLNAIREKVRRGGNHGVTGKDLVKLSQVFETKISTGARLIPESAVSNLYFNGSYRDKQIALLATKSPTKLREMLTDTTVPSGFSKAEWWERKKAIVKKALTWKRTRIDKETLDYIIEEWGHEDDVRECIVKDLEKPQPFPNAILTVSEWYIYSERLKRRRLSDIFKKGIFGWFWKRLGEW